MRFSLATVALMFGLQTQALAVPHMIAELQCESVTEAMDAGMSVTVVYSPNTQSHFLRVTETTFAGENMSLEAANRVDGSSHVIEGAVDYHGANYALAVNQSLNPQEGFVGALRHLPTGRLNLLRCQVPR